MGYGACHRCGKVGELRLGFCWDCASWGESRAARRSVWQHIRKGLTNIRNRNDNWRYDFRWAWQRLTKTGDYGRDGYFARYGIEVDNAHR